jgi:putative membrane protein insertion efficiency factor
MTRSRARAVWGVLGRVPRLGMIGLVRTYQVLWSPLVGARCRYYPSCSAYAVTALGRFGVLKGVGLAAWRVLRCNPWSRGGVDHVPAGGAAVPGSAGGRDLCRLAAPRGME